MSSSRRPWYPWYPNDFNGDEKVKCLPPLAELIYRRALDLMWQSNSIRIPAAMPLLLQSLGSGIEPHEFELMWERIQYPDFELFRTEDDGKWVYSDRLRKEADHIKDLSEKKKNAGKTGAKARWGKAKIADAKQTDSNRIADAKQTDSHSYSDVITKVSGNGLPYKKIIDHLNQKANTKYRSSTKSTQRFIKARFNEGFTLPDFLTVIDHKSREWACDPKMVQYLRPETLFGTKFESYLQKIQPSCNVISIPTPE